MEANGCCGSLQAVEHFVTSVLFTLLDGLRTQKLVLNEIPTLMTDSLRLRAFRAGDLDASAAMPANPAVMRYLGTGRISAPVKVWRIMATFIGCISIFHPLDWPESEMINSFD